MANLILQGDFVYDGRVQRGGHAMYVLHWLHGLERLGHKVVLLNHVGDDQLKERAGTLRRFGELVSEWWHPDRTALLYRNDSIFGMDKHQLTQFAREAAALITLGVPGRRQVAEVVAEVRPRILVDQDPGYPHLWAAGSDPRDIFGEPDFYFTVGGNIGTKRCRVPTFGINWRPIWNPVVTDWWSADAPITRQRFTTVADWYSYSYLEFEGKSLGPKSEEFRKFIALPQMSGAAFEIAIDIHPHDQDVLLLQQHGWKLESPTVVGTPDLYRNYVSGSLGEFSCAKGGYVGTRGGWFSDRSACYLAAGRPVVLQGTGFADLLPTGRGLFSVTSVEEARNAIQAIRKDYQQHSAAAREIALEHFDSNRILTHLLAETGIPSRGV